MLIFSIVFIASGTLTTIQLSTQKVDFFNKRKSIVLSFFAIIIGILILREPELNIEYDLFYIGIYFVLFSVLSIDFNKNIYNTTSNKGLLMTLLLISQFIFGSFLVLFSEHLFLDNHILIGICFVLIALIIYQNNIQSILQPEMVSKLNLNQN